MIRPILVLLLLSASTIEGAYALKEGKLVHHEELASMSVQEHHSAALEALHTRNWQELIRQATIITKNFPGTPFSHESYFFLGKGNLELKEFDLANQYLTLYLKKQGMPKHFEEAMAGKLTVADQFRNGAKKHLMGMEALPKWVPARDEALKIYDEISTAMPNHELAARALLGKSLLLFEEEDFKQAVENLQTLIRRFPRHDLAAQAFLEIGHFYLKQVQEEFADPDLLDLAEINLRKFKAEFPSDMRLEPAQKSFQQMQEFFAQNLLDTGKFFERTKKPHAALIYYARILRDFSATQVARQAQARITVLKPSADDPSKSVSDPKETAKEDAVSEKPSTVGDDIVENKEAPSISEKTVHRDEAPTASPIVSDDIVENKEAPSISEETVHTDEAPATLPTISNDTVENNEALFELPPVSGEMLENDQA